MSKMTVAEAKRAVRIGQKANRLLREVESKKEIARLGKLVGRAFRYENSFGSGTEWPLYFFVYAAKNESLHVLTVQTTERGDTEADMDTYWGSTIIESGSPISADEFFAAWDSAVADMNSLIAPFR